MSRDLLSVLDPIVDRVNRRFCWIKTKDGPRRIDEPLTPKKIAAHLTGRKAYGVCPMVPGESTTRLALFDFDSHDGATPWDEMQRIALDVISQCEPRGLKPIPFRSSGGRGIHLFFLWREPQDAYSVRMLLTDVLADALLTPGAGGVAKAQVEVFPKQNSIPNDGYGSMFVLPYAGESVPLDSSLDPCTKDFEVTWRASEPVALRERPVVERTAVDAPELAKLKAALDAIPNNEAESLDYDEWRNVLFAIHHATDGSEEGRALAHAFSARSSKYDPEFLDHRVWPYIRSDRETAVTAKTIFAKAREYGYQEPVADDFEVLLPEEQESHTVTVLADGTEVIQAKRFNVLTEDDLFSIPRPPWIVKGVLPKAELAVVYGVSGSGKSFWVTDLMGAIARGVEWRGLRVKKSNVVYLAAEGQGGFRNRLEAYRQHFGVKSELRIILDAPNLLKADAKPLAEQIVATGGAEIIVIDTLAQVSPGGDENSAEDMGRVLWNCKMIHRATGALIVLIHHAGKDLTKGARGWSGLKAAADVEIEINRLDSSRWAKITKSKDGEDGAEFPFRLLPITIGEDEDGDAITSCVVEHGQERSNGPREPKGINNALVWRIANRLAEIGDSSVPVSVLVAEAIREMPENRDAKGKDRRRFLARRAIETLAKENFFTVRDDVVYVGVGELAA